MASIVKSVVNWGSNSRVKTPVPVQADLCEICGKKPKYVENGHKHPYCSRSCARNGSGPSPAACMLRGCRATGKPAFANFCSEVHAKEGVRLGQVEGCDLCSSQPRTVGSLCITCDRRVCAEPQLREVSSDGKLYKSIRSQFLSEWEPGKTAPSFCKAYEIILPRDVRSRHDIYRASNPKFEEVRSFHSSQCICDLGTRGPILCNFKSCGICCIVRSCFKSLAFGATFNSGRFGEGLYSYRNPALADSFSTSCTSSPYRVIIACDVSVLPVDESADEESLFVPVADAILPVYVIIYST
ncbi:hypothetical protein HYPSUDRAFT_47611 [Hypholoma sublateritium FD-334 SS-4]|uniref:PARP catalytic domain-containing protein n=1 Tax=Hypholoma sublateritium (strain FD-334 SS-4) TaxID=945553 RepID=A0A0D2P731_HYPSF|nr:hypothetical protein HYPSUDRAFT_47611 [Hypholoma sublateritium FD-334 SS-4]